MKLFKIFLYLSVTLINIPYNYAEESNNHRNEEITEKSDKKEQKSIMQHVKKIISDSSNSAKQWSKEHPGTATVLTFESLAFLISFITAQKAKNHAVIGLGTFASLNALGGGAYFLHDAAVIANCKYTGSNMAVAGIVNDIYTIYAFFYAIPGIILVAAGIAGIHLSFTC